MTLVNPETAKQLQPSRLNLWRQARRLRKAARLLKRHRIARLDYALITADVISRVQAGRPIAPGDRLDWIGFGLEGLIALGVSIQEFGTPKDEQYGPLGDVPFILGDAFGVYQGTGDYQDRQNNQFVWGEKSADLLWRASMRLGLGARILERLDRWKAKQEAFAPAVHGDIWKLALAILGMVVTYLLGRFGIP